MRWANFLSTGNNFTEIQLDRNSTTLIIGENGAGKSTILDALCFGLFGKPFRGGLLGEKVRPSRQIGRRSIGKYARGRHAGP